MDNVVICEEAYYNCLRFAHPAGPIVSRLLAPWAPLFIDLGSVLVPKSGTCWGPGGALVVYRCAWGPLGATCRCKLGSWGVLGVALGGPMPQNVCFYEGKTDVFKKASKINKKHEK